MLPEPTTGSGETWNLGFETPLRVALFRYIESFYNPLRRHSSLEMLSPNNYEARYWETATAAAAA